MKDNQLKIQLTESQLREMSEEERKALFGGKDPLKDMGGVSGKALGLALGSALTLILGFFFFIQFVVQPSVVPELEQGSFELGLQEEHPALATAEYRIARGYWNTGQFDEFVNSSRDFVAAGLLDPEQSEELQALKELHRYTARALLLTEAYDEAREYIRFVQSRYNNDSVFMSDMFYYRGHIILHTRTYADAYGAFHEAHALGGRYAEAAERAKNEIESMNSPLW